MSTVDTQTGRSVLLRKVADASGSASARALEAAGADVIGQYLSTPESTRSRRRRAATAARPIDALAVNAATMAATPFDGSDGAAGWQRLYTVNVITVGALLRETVCGFGIRGGETAAAVSSWAAEQGPHVLDASGYAASKAAILTLHTNWPATTRGPGCASTSWRRALRTQAWVSPTRTHRAGRPSLTAPPWAASSLRSPSLTGSTLDVERSTTCPLERTNIS